MNKDLLIIGFSFLFVILVICKICFKDKLEDENIERFKVNNNTEVNNIYDLHVYDWGAQISIKDIESVLNHGDVYDDEFIWSRKPIKYSGFYHLDTGSHLLVDMVLMNRTEMINNLKSNNIKFDDLGDSGYVYMQGGTPPVSYKQNIKIDNKEYNNVPVCLMALNNQHMMEKEREAVSGLFGLSNIGRNHNLSQYSILQKLLENVSNKTILLDFKNSKMITGLSSPEGDFHFKGSILKADDNDLHRMEVEVVDSDTNKKYNILIDTGTLYSQFEYSGEVLLKGINTNSGFIKLNNARLLPLKLTGNIRQIILGFNDLYKGRMYIDYDKNLIYLEQNN